MNCAFEPAFAWLELHELLDLVTEPSFVCEAAAGHPHWILVSVRSGRGAYVMARIVPEHSQNQLLHPSGYENGHVVAPATVSCSATALYFFLAALLVSALRNASGTVPLRSLPLPSWVILKALQET